MQQKWKRFSGILFGLVLVLMLGMMTVRTEAAEKTITGLGTGAIGNPTPGAGGWSYVYYGQYSGNAEKYRVLDTAATEFNANKTMLLDCDSTIEKKRFNKVSNDWSASEIRSWLNRIFYNNQTGLHAPERAAIAVSTKSTAAPGDGDGWPGRLRYTPLDGDYIFILDAMEATRPSYGYANTDIYDAYKIKSGSDTWWWLRSAHYDSTENECVGNVSDVGSIGNDRVNNTAGVSPAFNLDLKSIIFSSLISGTAGSAGAEYKLTIKDKDMTIAKTGGSDVTRVGNVVTVPYTISESNEMHAATQVSVLITDSKYSAGTATTSGYSYLKLGDAIWDKSGTGTFTLPDKYADKTCGRDYYAYILAEDVNTGKATDYASAPVEISIPQKDKGGSNDTKKGKISISKRPSSVKARAKKNKVTVTWKKIRKNKAGRKLLKKIKSIQVQYSTDKAFITNVKTKTVGKKKTNVTLKLRKKTTYYIRVRYKGAKGFSKWSKVKKVKTKK